MSQVQGQKVWSDLVYDNGAIAKTKGTFDKINTNAEAVRIEKNNAKSVIGFLVAYAQLVTTDAENLANLILQVTNKGLGISEEEIVIPRGGNDADANNEYTPVETVFVPFKAPVGKSLFNTEFNFKAAPSVTNTGGFDVVIAVLYSDAEPDSFFAMELLAQMHGRVGGGAFNADAAKAHAAAAGAVALSSIIVQAGATMLRAIFAGINPNGITAGDPICGFMEYTAPGIDDFSPQLWPLSISWNAALGTVAESAALSAKGRFYTTRFPLTGARLTINVSSTLLTVAATAPDTTQGVLYDR